MTRLLKRIGAIGDVHAEDDALASVLDFFGNQRLETIVCVGDVVDGYGDAGRCVRLLRDHDVQVVRGNHERWWIEGSHRNVQGPTGMLPPEETAYLSRLPTCLELETVLGPCMLCHGIGEDDMAVLYPETRGYGLQAIRGLRGLICREDLSLLIGGHTHQRMVRVLDGLTVINVGTLHRDFEPSCTILDFAERRVFHHSVAPPYGCLEEEPLPPCRTCLSCAET
ncbi:MAG: metallophosphoesterase family protein [Myxococcota bacterium]